MKKKCILVLSLLAISLCSAHEKSHWHSRSKVKRAQAKKEEAPVAEVSKPKKEIQIERDTQEYTLAQISETPRIFLVENFLSQDECDHFIQLAKPNLVQEDEQSPPFSAILKTGKDKILTRVEKRIAKLTKTPVENGEAFHVTQYKDKQQYMLDWDYLWRTPEALQSNTKQYEASIVIYLYDTEEGGETIFPYANKSIKPVKGSAVLYYNLLPNGECDPMSLHGTAPVLKGEKWTVTKCLRQ